MDEIKSLIVTVLRGAVGVGDIDAVGDWSPDNRLEVFLLNDDQPLFITIGTS